MQHSIGKVALVHVLRFTDHHLQIRIKLDFVLIFFHLFQYIACQAIHSRISGVVLPSLGELFMMLSPDFLSELIELFADLLAFCAIK